MEIVIDERRNDADFGQAHPKAYIFGSIFHEERHRVPLGIAPAQEIVGHSVTVRLHLKQGITRDYNRYTMRRDLLNNVLRLWAGIFLLKI